MATYNRYGSRITEAGAPQPRRGTQLRRRTEDASQERVNHARQLGRKEGLYDGERMGRATGHAEGFSAGRRQGYRQGFDDGAAVGRKTVPVKIESAYFIPKDHLNAKALIIEPRAVVTGYSSYGGTYSARQEVIADITVFATESSLLSAHPTTVLKGVRIVHKGLVAQSFRAIGHAMPVRVAPDELMSGSAWMFKDLPTGVGYIITGYLSARVPA